MDTTTFEDSGQELPTQKISQTRKLKVILPQCCAALAIFAVNLSHEILEPIMYTVIHSTGIESTSMIYSYVLSTCIGLLVGGIVAQITGARVIVMFAGAVSAASWITMEWVSSVNVLQWTFFITIISKGFMHAPAYVYLAEISQPNMRNALVVAMCLSSDIGPVYSHVTGTGSTRIIAVVNVFFALVGVFVMFFLPDSPYWLANKRRYHAVELSLAWFRGWTSVENVKSESKEIISNAQNSPTACKLFCQKSLYKAAVTIGYVFLVISFVRVFFIIYSLAGQKLFIEYLGLHNVMSKMFLVFGISSVFVSITFVVLVSVIGKRVIFLISLFGGSIALLVAAIASYLRESQIFSESVHAVFLLICLTVVHFSLAIGIVPVPLILNSELFPSKLRNLGAGFILLLVHIGLLVSIHIYSYYFTFAIDALLTIALASMFGFISLVWLFPQNENISLAEIEHRSSKSGRNELR